MSGPYSSGVSLLMVWTMPAVSLLMVRISKVVFASHAYIAPEDVGLTAAKSSDDVTPQPLPDVPERFKTKMLMNFRLKRRNATTLRFSSVMANSS